MCKIQHVFVFLCSVFFSSCTLLSPLSLKPPEKNAAEQRSEIVSLSQFNGEYLMFPDGISPGNYSLDDLFTYKSVFSSDKLPEPNDYIRLQAIDERRLKATLFVNDRIVKSRIIKGRRSGSFFEFHRSHMAFKFISTIYSKQTGRLTLTKEQNLCMDINSGGIAFFLFVPIPLSGSAHDTYSLMYLRRK